MDENIPKKVIDFLIEKDLDVKIATAGIKDTEVARLVKMERRVLLTLDKHFANILMYPPKEYYGIILINIRPPLIKTVLNALILLFTSLRLSEFKGRLFIVFSQGFRVFPKYN